MTETNPAPDYKQAVSAQFASRPTLGEVAARRILALLTEHHPLIATARPELTSAACFTLMRPEAGAWKGHPLVDAVLDALREGRRLDLGKVGGLDHYLSLEPPKRFYVIEDDFTTAEGDVLKLELLTDAFNELLQGLIDDFCVAQVTYWNQPGSVGVSRDEWLQQLIRSALLHNLPLQGLDAEQRSAVLGLLDGVKQQPTAFLVEAELRSERTLQSLKLPNLLLHGELDDRQVVLWCSPSSVIKTFDGFDSFAETLRDEVAELHDFDTLGWTRHVLQGDAIAMQSARLLDLMLASVRALSCSRFADLDDLQTGFATLTDPSQWFLQGYYVQADASLALPRTVMQAQGVGSFAYQFALYRLALAQAQQQADGQGWLDGVLDLAGYASQQVLAAISAAHPDHGLTSSDAVLLTFISSTGAPGSGFGMLEPEVISLTRFAIDNLGTWVADGKILESVALKDDALVPAWMTLDYIKAVVRTADIGGRYPAYLRKQLDRLAGEQQRVTACLREWRCALLFAGLARYVDGHLSEAGLQCLCDFSADRLSDGLPGVTLMPLAFRPKDMLERFDQVTGMYLLYAPELSVVLLYRPQLDDALLEFSDLGQMMQRIRDDLGLQAEILPWLSDDARPIYANGGFREPILGGHIIDTALLPERPEPAQFAARFWNTDKAARVCAARGDLLVELARRRSLSNRQSDATIGSTGLWLLMEVISLAPVGPVAFVAWIALAIKSVSQDLDGLIRGPAVERSQAIVDLLMNAALVLMHARVPQGAQAAPVPAQVTVLQQALTVKGWPRFGAKSQPPAGIPASLPPAQITALDFTWRGNSGFNVLTPTQRSRVLAMRVDVSLQGQQMLASGPGTGLYLIADHHYAVMQGDVYAVDVSGAEVHLLDHDGAAGPRLSLQHGAWRLDSGLRLAGGMPPKRLEALRRQNQARFQALVSQEAELTSASSAMLATFKEIAARLKVVATRINELKAKAERSPEEQQELDVRQRHYQLERPEVMTSLRALISKNIELDTLYQQIEPLERYGANADSGLIIKRGAIRQNLLEYCQTYYNEAVELIEQESLSELAKLIKVDIPNVSMGSRYLVYRAALKRVIDWRIKLVEVAGILDDMLDKTQRDTFIYFRNPRTGARISKEGYIRDAIRKRRLSSIELDYSLLLEQAEMSLVREAQIEPETLLHYKQCLAGDALKSAGLSHSLLASSNRSLVEDVQVLRDALASYEETLALTDYLNAVGKVGINADALRGYVTTLERMKSVAERDLQAALRELQANEPRPARFRAFEPRETQSRLGKTRKGRVVLTEKVEGQAFYEQRDSNDNSVLKRFEEQEGELIEVDSTPGEPVTALSVQKARSIARRLLGDSPRTISLARSFVRKGEPNGLRSVFEFHIEQLSEVRAVLADSSADASLLQKLDHDLIELATRRDEELVQAYFRTPLPTADALRFLISQGKVGVNLVRQRISTVSKDFIDIYEIRKQDERGESGLWQAHLHYPAKDAAARSFSAAHLKLWSQAGLRGSGAAGQAIFRGTLDLAQVEELLPLPDTRG